MPGFGNLRIAPRQRKWDKLRPKAKIARLGPSHDADNSWMVGNPEVVQSRHHEISTGKSASEQDCPRNAVHEGTSGSRPM